ncbi:MAG: non-canonical purine NTP pyrophosphatase [Firmicutes bacterium]|nr:non-canonical purine NTP pyrophosphatase [Bacillota bacterium]MCL5063813.1 non-canonical purine NTP pyrophosphatase [Bacillota bacterium]
MLPAELLLASHNPGKVREFQRLFSPYQIVVKAPYATDQDLVEETGSTYWENARLKAVHVAKSTGMATLADDSGVEVEALDGAPGIHSARFVSESAWENSREILLRLMDVPVARRGARMVAVLVVVDGQGREIASSQGVLEGTILTFPKGQGGFGVDPIFSVDGTTSLAEWPAEEKDRWSHRGRAVRQLIEICGPPPAGLG